MKMMRISLHFFLGLWQDYGRRILSFFSSRTNYSSPNTSRFSSLESLHIIFAFSIEFQTMQGYRIVSPFSLWLILSFNFLKLRTDATFSKRDLMTLPLPHQVLQGAPSLSLWLTTLYILSVYFRWALTVSQAHLHTRKTSGCQTDITEVPFHEEEGRKHLNN